MLEVKDISKVYQTGSVQTIALKGASFKINDGEFVAIMGPSGSGKSTLMHILGCLDTPTSGSYLLDKKDVSKLSDDELAAVRKNKIGFVFQTFNLLPRTTVLRNVCLPLVYANVDKDKREQLAKAALKSVGLGEDRYNHTSSQLSGGQMQRVAIARALVNDPTLILADEPTGNLDSKTSGIVLATFQDLNDHHGKTIVLITHEHDVAECADRIIHILDGEVVKDQANQRKRLAKVNLKDNL